MATTNAVPHTSVTNVHTNYFLFFLVFDDESRFYIVRYWERKREMNYCFIDRIVYSISKKKLTNFYFDIKFMFYVVFRIFMRPHCNYLQNKESNPKQIVVCNHLEGFHSFSVQIAWMNKIGTTNKNREKKTRSYWTLLVLLVRERRCKKKFLLFFREVQYINPLPFVCVLAEYSFG